MGMDFNMIMGHTLSIKEIGQLSENKKLWNSIDEFLMTELNYSPTDKYVKWTQEPTKENLIEFWEKIEKNEDYNKVMEIDCYFACIRVYRHTISIWFSTIFYSYKFFHHAKDTHQIMSLGRIFAESLKGDKVLYLPTGYIKTAIIEDYACCELTLEEAIKKGIKEFGKPPKGISKGRKNYFFIDYVNQEIGEIKEWEEEEDFWEWDEKEKDYVQIKNKTNT